MHNPLRYQISSYDCGPTSLLNAISYLFPREEIPAEIIRNIMFYSLDCYGPGELDKRRVVSWGAAVVLLFDCFFRKKG